MSVGAVYRREGGGGGGYAPRGDALGQRWVAGVRGGQSPRRQGASGRAPSWLPAVGPWIRVGATYFFLVRSGRHGVVAVGTSRRSRTRETISRLPRRALSSSRHVPCLFFFFFSCFRLRRRPCRFGRSCLPPLTPTPGAPPGRPAAGCRDERTTCRRSRRASHVAADAAACRCRRAGSCRQGARRWRRCTAAVAVQSRRGDRPSFPPSHPRAVRTCTLSSLPPVGDRSLASRAVPLCSLGGSLPSALRGKGGGRQPGRHPHPLAVSNRGAPAAVLRPDLSSSAPPRRRPALWGRPRAHLAAASGGAAAQPGPPADAT